MSIKNDGHYFCGAGGNRPDGSDEALTEKHERSTKDLVKAAVSGWLGTALEFMDFKSHSI
ncbi:hypothetical protein ACQUSI_005522 [Escherichia coli]